MSKFNLISVISNSLLKPKQFLVIVKRSRKFWRCNSCAKQSMQKTIENIRILSSYLPILPIRFYKSGKQVHFSLIHRPLCWIDRNVATFVNVNANVTINEFPLCFMFSGNKCRLDMYQLTNTLKLSKCIRRFHQSIKLLVC
jgi:hypothetical protein